MTGFPKMKNVLVLTFLICGLTALTTGLRCLRCNEVYKPILCNYITTCGYGETCGIEKVRNENGELRYNLGCKSTQICQDFKNLTDKGTLTRSSHRTSTYTTMCHDCCDKNICNSAGCGETGYPMDTGPVCMDCENIENPRSCDKIKACEQDEVCYIQEKILFHMKLFTSKCVQQYVCDPSNGNIFGRKKRDFGSEVKRSSNFCSKCCSVKLCNDHCGTDSFPTTATISTTLFSVSPTTGPGNNNPASSTEIVTTQPSTTTTLEPTTTETSCLGTLFEGRCYTLSSTIKSWTDASTDCQATGGHLVDITSKAENDLVKQLAATATRADMHIVWLGGTDKNKEGSYIWISNNQPLTFTDWYGTDPNGGSGQNCMSTYTSTYQWIDNSCSSKYFYICEK